MVADAAHLSLGYSEIAFLDDRFPALNRSGEWPVVGRLEAMKGLRTSFDAFFAAFGDPALRLRVLEEAEQCGFEVPIIIHPRATVARFVSFGVGTVVLAGAVVNFGASAGRSVIINSAAVVEHDCVLGDGVHVSPGACIAGEVTVGPRTWIGIGSVVRQCLKIGSDVMLGAGAVCVSDIPDHRVAIGVPARALRRDAVVGDEQG